MRGRSRPAGDLGLDAELDELEQAIRLCELDGGEGAALLNALAVALRLRYTAAGQRPNLERALDSARQAVATAAAPPCTPSASTLSATASPIASDWRDDVPTSTPSLTPTVSQRAKHPTLRPARR
jgi:hypothetical protein